MQQPGDRPLSLLMYQRVPGGPWDQRDVGSRVMANSEAVCDCHVSSLSHSPVAGPTRKENVPPSLLLLSRTFYLIDVEAEADWDTTQWGGESWLCGNPDPMTGAAPKPVSSYSQSRPLFWLIFWNLAPVALRSFKNSFKRWKLLKPPLALELFTGWSPIWFLNRVWLILSKCLVFLEGFFFFLLPHHSFSLILNGSCSFPVCLICPDSY